jgi:polysaccharide deacetylase family protein (PEP-CTERM system associated)
VARVPPETGGPLANVLTVDVEEYYHGQEFAHALGAANLARLPSRVGPQTERLLDVLDAHGARATFFVLGVVAQRHPRLVRAIARRGHEVASHGWDHTLVPALGPARFRADVRMARHAVEQAAGCPVWGYRAPNYSIRRDTPWALRILLEEGYAYDSSVVPITHDRYGFPGAPRFPHRALDVDGQVLWEVPVGTVRFGTNVPLGGGFFRLFPGVLLQAAIARVNRVDGRPVVLYVHPWEFDPGQPRPPMNAMHRFRHYVGLGRAEARLGGLLRAFRFTSIAVAHRPVLPAAARRAAAAAASA